MLYAYIFDTELGCVSIVLRRLQGQPIQLLCVDKIVLQQRK